MAKLINPGGSPDDTSILYHSVPYQFTFGKPDWLSIDDIMYINIAISSETAGTPLSLNPSISLQAGDGDGVNLDTGYKDIYCSTSHSMDARVGGARLTAMENDVYQVEIRGVNGSGGIGNVPDEWTVTITNNDTDRHVTWVVADNAGDACQPWMEVPPSLDFSEPGTILTGQTANFGVTITNRGTGPLTITGPFGAIETLAETGTILSSGGFHVDGGSISIAPNSCQEVNIRFDAPASPGNCSASVEFDGDTEAKADTGVKHNKLLNLMASYRTMEIVMVLDGSGSMSLTEDGSSTAANPEDSRWGHLKDAALQFLDLLGDFSGGKGRIGILLFPDIVTPGADVFSDITSHVLWVADTIPDDMTDIKNSLEGYSPVGRTPMGKGIAAAMGEDAGSFGEFQDPTTAHALDDNNNCRWMVLMSDGAHNLGPPHPDDFYGEGGISFKTKKVRVFGVAYGNPGNGVPWPPREQMDILAVQSDGMCHAAEPYEPDQPFPLRKAFREAITTTLALDPTNDPSGTLYADRSVSRHLVNILPHETRAAFVVNWGQYSRERVSVRLVTPLCETITPEIAEQEENIRYHDHPRYAIYTVSQDYLRNTSAQGHPRYGQWTLIITGHGLAGEDQEVYTYDVITRSGLKMLPRFDRPGYSAGDTIKISVSLRLNGLPISDATISVRMRAPRQLAQNWIARKTVSPKEFQKAKDQLDGRDVTDLDIKTHAVWQRGEKFKTVVRHAEFKMTETTERGVYSAIFTRTEVPGAYRFHITAVGHTRDGVPFRRERQIQQIVDVRPAASATFFHAAYRRNVGEKDDYLNIDLRVWPRDQFNNVLLSPSGLGRQIALTVQGAHPDAPLRDNLDGSYSGVFRCAVDTRPAIHLSIKGHEIIASQRLLVAARLHYANEVRKFEPGLTGGDDKIQHDNPQDALGDVTLKGDDVYVNLGFSGSLTLGIRDQAIFPSDDDDVTVFVRLAEERGTYQVEALPVRAVSQWVELGTSPGVTRSFSLRSTGIGAVRAIRINDRSVSDLAEQSRQDSGVAIIGVGFGKVGPVPGQPDGCLAWPLAILRRLASQS